MSNLSKNAKKQIKRHIKNGTKISNQHALNVLKKTKILNELLSYGGKGLNKILVGGL